MKLTQRLLNLLATTANPKAQAELKPRVEQNSDDEASIYLYDVIDKYYGISASAFVRELNAIKATTIHLRINSPGGDVFEARAIKTALDQHSAKIVAHIDGIAASAASFIMLAGDEIEMSRGAMVMVHRAWGFAYGNVDDMRSSADLLEKVDNQIANDYARKTGKTVAAVAAWMKAETWFDEEEAVESGLVDRIFDADAVENVFDLRVFDNAPEQFQKKPPKTDDTNEINARLRAVAERRLVMIERTA